MKKQPKKKQDSTIKTKKVKFSLLAPEARTACLAGNFNEWDIFSHPMKKDKKGLWSISVSLPYGQHEYLFFVDGQWIFDPNCDCSVNNMFGTENCLVTVE